MDLPVVTIITTVFHKRPTIVDTINSVLIQTYPKIQYIVVDDGPNSVNDDEINELLANSTNIISYKILHNEKNMGTSYSLNLAVEQSVGEIIFEIADDDVFYDENVILDWTNEFIRTGADIITAKREIYSQDLSQSFGIHPDDNESNIIKNKSAKELFEHMVGYNIVIGCVTAKRASFLHSEIGRYNETYRIIEDYPAAMKALRNGVPIHFFDRIVIKYRIGGCSYVMNVDSKYIKEANLVFKKEILPYTSDKIRAIYLYWLWKRFMRKEKRKNDNNK